MIVGDTGAVLALLDTAHPEHAGLYGLWQADPDAWLLPWAVLPEIDYLARRLLGDRVARLFLADVASAAFAVEHGQPADLARAAELDTQHASMQAGLTDCVVVAVAERVHARGIATLDLRHIPVLAPQFPLYPRDL